MQGYTADYLPVFVPGLGLQTAGRFVQVRPVGLLAAFGDEIIGEIVE